MLFNIVCGVIFLFFSIIWSSNSFLNVLIKMSFIFMAVWAGLNILFMVFPENVTTSGIRIW